MAHIRGFAKFLQIQIGRLSNLSGVTAKRYIKMILPQYSLAWRTQIVAKLYPGSSGGICLLGPLDVYRDVKQLK